MIYLLFLAAFVACLLPYRTISVHLHALARRYDRRRRLPRINLSLVLLPPPQPRLSLP